MRLGTRPRWREDGGQGKGQEKGESLPGLWKLCGKRGSDAAAVRWLQDGSILQVRSSNLARVASHRGSLGRVRSELPDRHHILTPTCIHHICCSRVCQKQHWKDTHKAQCLRIQAKSVGADAATAAAAASSKATAVRPALPLAMPNTAVLPVPARLRRARYSVETTRSSLVVYPSISFLVGATQAPIRRVEKT